jgi:ABC-type oligopeptide transport system ATPase subunit
MGIFAFLNKKEKKPYIAFTLVETKKGSYDEFYKKFLNTSLIMLVVGKRGSGKTSLGMKLIELFRKKTKHKCYVLGYEKIRLPWWLKKAAKLENIPNNSVALLDEGAITFSAREPMKEINKMLSKFIAVARHKNLSLILITQNSAMIDLNVLRLSDTLFLKEPSLLQSKFERKALRDIYEKITPCFRKVENKKAYFYVWDDDFEGVLKYSLPEFWNEKISKSFRDFR